MRGCTMNEHLLIGNNLSVLVAAHELALRGGRVTLCTDGKPLGGHFAGLQIDGQDFDMGMVLLEQHAPAQPGIDLRNFAPVVRNDWTRFGDHAWTWLQGQVDLCRTPTPQVLVQDRVHPDYLIANRLEAFAGAKVGAPAPLEATDERHAAHKNRPGAYDRLDYAQAAQFNHGTEL